LACLKKSKASNGGKASIIVAGAIRIRIKGKVII
jgi:hypothetical protein